MIKIQIYLQSISSIITNSSSEVFAYITSEDKLDEIYAIINQLFGWNQESEITPCVDIKDNDNTVYTKVLPQRYIEIELPYHLSFAEEFYSAGLEAILNDKFGKDNYKIIYIDKD